MAGSHVTISNNNNKWIVSTQTYYISLPLQPYESLLLDLSPKKQ